MTNLPYSKNSHFRELTFKESLQNALSSVNWDLKDVMTGALKNRNQLDVCLRNKFYHIPAVQLNEEDFPVNYIALYQSANLFGRESGIRIYGEVESVSKVKRYEIKEIYKNSDELYYKFKIKDWMLLENPIEVKEMGFVKAKTNLFLLKNSPDIPGLFLNSEDEFKLYYALKCIGAKENIPNCGFKFKNSIVIIENGKIIICKNDEVKAEFSFREFMFRSNFIFPKIFKSINEE